MIALLQRVAHAKVMVEQQTIAQIEQGLAVLLAIEKDDQEPTLQRMLQRLLAYRVFSDAHGKMNLSLQDVQGGLLLVPQFTLAADTDKGLRPSFSNAASPAFALQQFECFLESAKTAYPHVQSGKFGANMQVHLINDGPVTFWLKVKNINNINKIH